MTHLPKKRIHLQPEENIIIVVRKHWIMLLADSLGIIFFGLLAIAIFGVIAAPGGYVSPEYVFGVMLWLLIVWTLLFTVWTNYYLDMWIVTDKRIINIDQIDLFKRTKSTLRVERVQDVTVKKHGILQELFNFGTIKVQTASAENSISIIKGVPNPNGIQRAILKHVDTVTENKNRLTHITKTKPTHSE